MEQRQAGRSGLALSVLGLSTRSWGREMDGDAATAALAAFRDAGGTFVDTTAAAPADGHRDTVGRGESLLGALLTGDRDAMVIGAGPLPVAGSGSSRTAVLRGLTDSLRRLRCDHIDLWQVPSTLSGAPPLAGAGQTLPAVPFEETLSAMDAAVTSGKERYVGLGEPVPWRLARAATWQQAWPGRAPVVTNHVGYSLLDRRAEPHLVEAATELGIGLICSSFDAGPGGDAESNGRTARLIEAVATAADGLATTALAMSLSWLRERPAVTSMVVDARTPAHFGAALTSLELSVPDPIRRVLDEVSEPSRHAGWS